jgi:pimeloyl-ACP methyl ester carboxylesterase
MWKVTALKEDGSTEDIDVQHTREQQPFDVADMARLAADFRTGRAHAFELMERESQSEDDNLRFAAIETWAKQAVEQAEYFDWTGAPKLGEVERGIARYGNRCDGRPVCVAWHDQSSVVIPLLGNKLELTIEYVPDRHDEQHVARLIHRHGSPDHDLETLLDWRAYIGHETGIVDGWTLMRQSGRGYTASLVGATGFVVATALRRITTKEITLTADPRRGSRLAEMEAAWPYIADSCPRLDETANINADVAMVFVHGTASCGIAGLKDLFSLATQGFSVPGRVLRFEHDTFVPITDNAQALSQLIKDRLRVRKLLIAAHSRGGLVACDAAKLLKEASYAGDVTVYSFGTPYQGTPLVAMGKKALNLMMKLGEEMATHLPVPVLSPLAKAMFYVMEAPTLPKGIIAMHEDAPDLAYLQRFASAIRLLSWGSHYDVMRGSAGFGVGAEGFLLGALHGSEHDLVVPRLSALACGSAQPALDCSHVHYFRAPQVRDAIETFLRPLPLQAAPPAPPPAMDDTVTADLNTLKRKVPPNKFKLKPGGAASNDQDAPTATRS